MLALAIAFLIVHSSCLFCFLIECSMMESASEPTQESTERPFDRYFCFLVVSRGHKEVLPCDVDVTRKSYYFLAAPQGSYYGCIECLHLLLQLRT